MDNSYQSQEQWANADLNRVPSRRPRWAYIRSVMGQGRRARWLRAGTPMTPSDRSSTDASLPHPRAALRTYLDTRQHELSAATQQAHKYRLGHFIRWCEQEDITDMNTLDGTDLHQFRLWRQRDGDLNPVSVHTQLSTLRVFLKFCERIEIVTDSLYEAVILPDLADGQDQRTTTLSPDQADAALDYLDTYEYASADHITLLLLWRTGMRVGALRSLDVDDYAPQAARLHAQHRPQGGTTLKQGVGGERYIALHRTVCTALNDYLDATRADVTDEHGRQPLVVFSNRGRPARSTIRRHVHRCTQPCLWHGTCPHDRSMDSCPDIGHGDGFDCPSSRPPHDVRRGAITHWLAQDVPKPAVADRMNVTEGVLDAHYDQRTPETKAEQRRQFLDDTSPTDD